ncbi:unnamed protein product [Closterium sp. NIES-54]
MAEYNIATLTQEQLDRLVSQLENSALDVATPMASDPPGPVPSLRTARSLAPPSPVPSPRPALYLAQRPAPYLAQRPARYLSTATATATACAEGDCYRCVPPDPGIAAAALGASESGTLPGTVPAEALHTFTLDSGASRCFFRLHLPSFSTNLVSTAAFQDAMVTTTTPGGQRVSICTCTRTGHHLATFTRRPGSSLYTLATEPSQVAASAQVSASGQVAVSCSCRLLSHQTILWHHHLGHPSLPRLRGMHSRLLVSGLPRSLPPLPPSPAPPCLPCVEGWQRAAPHSSSFPPTTAPLQTLHMDRFGQDLPVLRLHSDRGGEFSSTLLWDFCRGEGILQSFTLLDSPQQNGIAERRIGLVMEVACTSMIHAAAPHFMWPFAVRYVAHQLNLWPCVSLLETSPTLRWTGKVGDASVFRVWGSRAFVRDTSADKLSPPANPSVFLGFVPDAPGWQFYHPTSCCVFPFQDVTFDESVPFYRCFPYRSAPPPPPPLFLAPGPPPVDPLPPQGPAPSGVPQVDPLPGPAPVQVAVDSGATRGTAFGGAKPGGAEPKGAESKCAETGGAEPGGVEPGSGEPGGAEPGGVEPGSGEPEGVEPGGAKSEGTESGGAEPQGAASFGGSAGASPRLSPQQLREWFVRRTRLWSDASGAGGAGAAGARGTGVAAGAGVTGGTVTTGPGGAHARGTGAVGAGGVEGAGAGDLMESSTTGTGGAGAGGAGVGGPDAGGAGVGGPGVAPGGTVRPRPYFVPLLQQPASPLPALSPYTEQTCGLTERREPASRPVSPVRTARRVPRSRPPPVRGTHHSSFLCSSTCSSASPTVSRLLATAATDPSFESAAASTLVAEQFYDLVFATADTEALTLVLQRFGFQFSSPQLTPLSTSHSLSAPPSDESVEPSGPYPELVGCLMYLMTCTPPDLAYPLSLVARYVAPDRHRKVHWDAAKRVLRYLCSTSGMGLVLGGRGPVVLTGHADASWVDDSTTQRSSQGYTFSLHSGSVSWRSTRSSSVLSSSCEAEIYAGAVATQELRWLTYLLTDLGEQPRSPPILYVDNKAMIALCQEHRSEHRTKHIALRYFIAQELQQRGQLRLAYVATRASTADVFTKALPPSEHQRLLAVLGLVPTLPHLLTA